MTFSPYYYRFINYNKTFHRYKIDVLLHLRSSTIKVGNYIVLTKRVKQSYQICYITLKKV